jgi:hypothetical protein
MSSSSVAHRNTIFTVTDQHLRLLKAASVKPSSEIDGSMFGAPTIDPRRPYGDRDVYRSMIRILDYKMPPNGSQKWDVETDEIPDATENALDQLHSEIEIVLKICLNRQSFETGQFYWPEPGEDWVKVGEKTGDEST